MGLLVTMLLQRVGARPIVTVDLHERRREASASAGADHVLDANVDLEPYWNPYGSCLMCLMRFALVLGERG